MENLGVFDEKNHINKYDYFKFYARYHHFTTGTLFWYYVFFTNYENVIINYTEEIFDAN